MNRSPTAKILPNFQEILCIWNKTKLNIDLDEDNRVKTAYFYTCSMLLKNIERRYNEIKRNDHNFNLLVRSKFNYPEERSSVNLFLFVTHHKYSQFIDCVVSAKPIIMITVMTFFSR